MLYSNWISKIFCRGHILVLMLATLLSYGSGVLLRAGASFWTYCALFWEPLSVALLTKLPTCSLFNVYDNWELSIGSWTSSFKILFYISILSWYEDKDVIKWVEDFLELILLEKVDIPLIMLLLMSISILDGSWAI